MAQVKKKVFLTTNEKCEIVKKVRNGVSKNAIINKYNISERFYRKIIHCADEIIDKSEDLEFKYKKTIRSAKNAELEASLLKWFVQKRDSGQPVSPTMLKEKALIFNEMLNGPPNFKASDGWFSRFKRRRGLKRLSLKGEILSDDSNSAEEFTKLLNEKIIKENLKLENIYNADESGIYWKILLNYTFGLSTENPVAGVEENKERFTALFCANVSGSHRFPLLIIGESARPTSLKNLIVGKAQLHDINYLEKFNVTYSAQGSGCMNSVIFKKWYKDEFIPKVNEHQRKIGISGKVLLILDNAPSHPSAEELNAIDGNFEVVFLPPNVTAIIQPMNQSPILTTKKNYKRNLLKKLLIEKDYEKIETFLKELNLHDCLGMLSTGWSDVKQTTLKNAWKPLLRNLETHMSVVNFSEKLMYDPDSFNSETNALVVESDPVYEFHQHLFNCLLKKDEQSEEMSKSLKLNIDEWFEADEGDSGWEIESDKQIVQSILNGQHNFDGLKSPSTVVEQTVYIDGGKMKCDIDQDEIMATNEAFQGFLKFKSWMTTHVQSSESQIFHLKEYENILRNAIDINNSQNERLFVSNSRHINVHFNKT